MACFCYTYRLVLLYKVKERTKEMRTEVKEIAQEVRVCCMNDCESNRVVFGLHTKVGEIWFCSKCLKANDDVLNGRY